MFSANSSQVSDDKLFVEDVFSTWLYTGTGAAQTITNGIDLAGKGGLVIQKERSSAYADGWFWGDTVRGANVILKSQNTNGQTTSANTISAFSSTGFTAGSNISFSGSTYASWTFREAPKFFDVVTWTGNGSFQRKLSHSLGVEPGFIIAKCTSSSGTNWMTYHRLNGSGANRTGKLNTTEAFTDSGWVYPGMSLFGDNPATTFYAYGDGTPQPYGGPEDQLNISGNTYVAYLFAHDATSDGIIQCGSYTGNGASEGPTVTLGWEPQWVIVKNASASSVWMMVDNMRGMTADGNCGRLDVNQSVSESATTGFPLAPNATGFQVKGATALNGNGQTSIYIAIRRGPMRTPTLGTSVFAPVLSTNTGTPKTVTTNFPVDLTIFRPRDISDGGLSLTIDRLRGGSRTNGRWLGTSSTGTESNYASYGVGLDSNVSLIDNLSQQIGYVDLPEVFWNFRRAPGFFDEVCYTGNAVNGRTINHNLGVTPELMIMKNRSSAGYNWFTWDKSADLSQAFALLALSNADGRPAFSSGNLNSTVPTSTVFTIGGDSNASGQNYVTYLFASAPGVSKVGSYTGNGSSQTINCGFAAGARFVMIKRTDAAGDWYVWDTARGIVAGNDPHLSLNTTAVEVTTDDTIDTDSSGFVVNQVSATNVNVNAATYIYLAIA